MRNDSDLANLRDDSRFALMLSRLENAEACARKIA